MGTEKSSMLVTRVGTREPVPRMEILDNRETAAADYVHRQQQRKNTKIARGPLFVG